MKHLAVKRNDGQYTLKELRRLRLIEEGFEILHVGNLLYIPVVDSASSEVSKFGEIVEMEGERRRRSNQPVGIKGSYDVIGNIVILKKSNTRDPETLAREIIKRPGVDSIYLDHGVFGKNRTRKLELLLGKDSGTTLYRENGIQLEVDVLEAYFSPRLATERMLVSNSVRDGDFVIDMFAGIGPFSILIARNHDCRVVSMDHNSRAIELLRHNMEINKLRGTISPVLGDAGREIQKYSGVDRVIMNLPHGAFQFARLAARAIKGGGIVNFYEVTTVDGIAERMSEMRDLGLELLSKREVHGYSRDEHMYSLELVKG